MTTAEKLALIERYYAACSTGDVPALTDTLTDDVTHYFLAPNPGSAPVSGALHLARYWRKAQERISGRWAVDRILGEADEAVIEWTLFWTTPVGERVATRGAEWYRFRDDRIAEIRAYYQQPETTTELRDFDYVGRGYSRLGDEVGAARPLVPEGAR
jgi:ketosteroid isomerase-like protein